jgi:RNA polymerase primary sigma factor
MVEENAGTRAQADEDYVRRDSLAIYLDKIGETPLLTVAEECSLSLQVQEHGDQAARERLILANLRFVVMLANRYQNCGLPMLDLIAEGNRGLMRGSGRYDARKGARFVTYAAWWIRQSICRAIARQGRLVRLPDKVIRDLARIRRTASVLSGELGHAATDEEIAERCGFTSSRVKEIKEGDIHQVSLDAPIGDGQESFGQIIRDERAIRPSDLAHSHQKADDMEEALRTLPAREAMVIRLRFGLSGEAPISLVDVGIRMKISRGRAGQLESAAMRRLRHAIFMNPVLRGKFRE